MKSFDKSIVLFSFFISSLSIFIAWFFTFGHYFSFIPKFYAFDALRTRAYFANILNSSSLRPLSYSYLICKIFSSFYEPVKNCCFYFPLGTVLELLQKYIDARAFLIITQTHLYLVFLTPHILL